MAERLDTERQTSADRFPNLETQVAKMLPTPKARDWKDGAVTAEQAASYQTQDLPRVVTESHGKVTSGWYLNPAFVEEMMGWPIGWAALKPLATAKIQEWRQQHSEFFHTAS